MRVGMLIGNKVGFVNKVVNRIFNTSWRTDPWWELFIGIGMHY